MRAGGWRIRDPHPEPQRALVETFFDSGSDRLLFLWCRLPVTPRGRAAATHRYRA
jgi:hypothetical protein